VGTVKKQEYHDGTGAQKNFEQAMQKLFRYPKFPKTGETA
jgi:hypothetical protein